MGGTISAVSTEGKVVVFFTLALSEGDIDKVDKQVTTNYATATTYTGG